jgi:S-methylmethionine-dependent homocysteine/selenocysteine methylase
MGVWSGTANIDAPDVVRQVHEDYLRLGADLITSNNFWTSRPRLALAGLADQWERYTRAAGELAVQARDAVNPEAYVAGGMAPPGEGDLRAEFLDQARVLAALGVDVMLAEFVATIADAVIAVDACATVGLPVFLGVCLLRADGSMRDGTRLEDLAVALRGHPVAAILLMCSRPEAISAGLPRLRQAFDGVIGGYANIGYDMNPKFGTGPEQQRFAIDEAAYSAYPPERYAVFGQAWQTMGAQIIGGCCATGPAHIAALRPLVKGQTRRVGHAQSTAPTGVHDENGEG